MRALEQGGEDLVAAALIARANVRWENVSANVPLLAPIVLPRIWRIAPVDALLQAAGLPYDADGSVGSSPAFPGPGWAGQLRWGLDSVAGMGRFIMLHQVVGASAVIRQQVERWTENRASVLKVARGPDRAAFVDRVWSDYPRNVRLGKVYADASSVLHGRGRWMPLVRWESADLCSWPPPGELVAMGVLAELGVMVQLVVTGTAIATLTDVPREYRDRLKAWPLVGEPSALELYAPLFPSILPLTPEVLANNFSEALVPHALIYESALANPDADGLPAESLAVLGFLHRRYRAGQMALAAFEQEQERVGDRFNWAEIARRETRYILVGESAGLAGIWVPGPRGDALLVGSQALRSAFLLWLEDDNRSMTATRTVLEAAARARVWRRKPDKARSLEDREDRTTLRDWLSAAGWSRLGVVSRALGELSHFSYDSRWSGALEALSAAQEDAEADPWALNTARGSGLEQAALLLAIEAAASVLESSSALGGAMRTILGLDTRSEDEVETWLQRSHQLRGFSFGDPDFQHVRHQTE